MNFGAWADSQRDFVVRYAKGLGRTLARHHLFPTFGLDSGTVMGEIAFAMGAQRAELRISVDEAPMLFATIAVLVAAGADLGDRHDSSDLTVEELAKKIAEWCSENGEGESGLLYPNPRHVVPTFDLLDMLAEATGLREEQVGRWFDEAQDSKLFR